MRILSPHIFHFKRAILRFLLPNDFCLGGFHPTQDNNIFKLVELKQFVTLQTLGYNMEFVSSFVNYEMDTLELNMDLGNVQMYKLLGQV